MYIVCQLVREAGVLSARFCKQTLRLVLYGDKQYIYIHRYRYFNVSSEALVC